MISGKGMEKSGMIYLMSVRLGDVTGFHVTWEVVEHEASGAVTGMERALVPRLLAVPQGSEG